MNGKTWKCNVCGSLVVGINWQRAIGGHQFHATLSGGECRVVNFEQVMTLPEGAKLIRSRDVDDTDEQPVIPSHEVGGSD